MSKFSSIKAEARSTVLLAGPIITASLLQVANGFIDTVMLGRYNAEHLAAGALGASLWIFIMLAGMGFSMGIAPIIAQLNGAKKIQDMAHVFQQGIWICIGLGIVLFFGLRSTVYLLTLLETEPVIIPLTKSYLYIVSWGVGLSQVFMAGQYLSEGIEYTRPLMIIQLLLLPINALGNYLFIFGHWGFAEMGVSGAGLSTSIVLMLGFLLMTLNLIYNKRYRHLNLFKQFSRPKYKTIRDILSISIPIALSMIFESSLFTTISLFMGKLGVLPLAGHQIAINYASLMFMFPLGIAIAATVRVGNSIGRNDYDNARLRGWVAIGLSCLFMTCSAIILLIFNKQIAMIYTNDINVIPVAVNLLILAGVFQISDGIQVSASGALRGYKDTKYPMVVNFIGYWLIGFPCAYYLCFNQHFNEQGLWWGLIIGLSVAAVLLLFRFNRFSTNFVLTD